MTLIASSRPSGSQVPQIQPPADIVHSKYSFTYLLTYLLTMENKETRQINQEDQVRLSRGRCEEFWPVPGGMLS